MKAGGGLSTAWPQVEPYILGKYIKYLSNNGGIETSALNDVCMVRIDHPVMPKRADAHGHRPLLILGTVCIVLARAEHEEARTPPVFAAGLKAHRCGRPFASLAKKQHACMLGTDAGMHAGFKTGLRTPSVNMQPGQLPLP